uniref:Uncharacterized protein n=1 Tax=viral metagenome TaxID=1070528 RepID=A0A6C0ADB0_9ZZZZ
MSKQIDILYKEEIYEIQKNFIKLYESILILVLIRDKCKISNTNNLLHIQKQLNKNLDTEFLSNRINNLETLKKQIDYMLIFEKKGKVILNEEFKNLIKNNYDDLKRFINILKMIKSNILDINYLTKVLKHRDADSIEFNINNLKKIINKGNFTENINLILPDVPKHKSNTILELPDVPKHKSNTILELPDVPKHKPNSEDKSKTKISLTKIKIDKPVAITEDINLIDL